jgi:hypothetical protein
MRAAIKALGMEGRKDEIRKLMKEIDADGSGDIDIEEFKTLFDRLKDEPGEDEDAVRQNNRKVAPRPALPFGERKRPASSCRILLLMLLMMMMMMLLPMFPMCVLGM